MSQRVDVLVSGCETEAHLRQMSSSCDKIEKATASIRSVQCRRESASVTGSSSNRLSDGQSEAVELAATELLSAVRQLGFALTQLA